MDCVLYLTLKQLSRRFSFASIAWYFKQNLASVRTENIFMEIHHTLFTIYIKSNFHLGQTQYLMITRPCRHLDEVSFFSPKVSYNYLFSLPLDGCSFDQIRPLHSFVSPHIIVYIR